MAWTDPVTSLPTPSNFFLALEVAIGHSQASGQPLSLLWVQIDGCSRTDPASGLGRVSKALRLALQSGQVLARGADCHFLVMLPAVPLESANEVARQMQVAVALATPHTNERPTTLSIGLACEPACAGWDGEDLLEIARRRCQVAQDAGGDRVESLGEGPGWPSTVAAS